MWIPKAEEQDMLDFVMRMGTLLMESGGEVYRAEDTVHRLCAVVPAFSDVDVLATPSWLILSVRSEDDRVYTKMRRVKPSRIDLHRVLIVNDISRSFTAGKLTVPKAQRLLDALLQRSRRQKNLQFLGGVTAPMCITLLGRASLSDASFAGLAAACLLVTDRFLERFHLSFFVRTLLDAMVGAMAALVFHRLGWVDNVALVIIGSIMLQFPGVSVANAMRDALSGDFITGQGELMQALAVALALGLGVGIMLLIFGVTV